VAKRRSSLRLFIALDLPVGARSEIAAWREPLIGGLRPVEECALHVTLVFLGSRDEAEVPRLEALASDAVAGRQPVLLAPTRVQAVPPRSPRLLALDLEDRGGHCLDLQSALAPAGGEERGFWPHVTFARAKRGHRAQPREASRLPAPFVADRIVLYRSLPGPGGSRYEPLWAATLGP